MPVITVAIPTLAGDEQLAACVRSVAGQEFSNFEIVVVDNSGQGRAARASGVRESASIIENAANVGFGAAVNQVVRGSSAPFVAVLNDDAVAHPGWLAAMLRAVERRYEIGMCAPLIRLAGTDTIDSAGMLAGYDGSSKQRGHGRPVSEFQRPGQVLFPSGCAALYRRAMLDDIGLFDESFFLYCEDADLGLRARWRMWECVYAPDAVVEHGYSRTSGRASTAKAWYVERNRMRVAIRNLPASLLALAPAYSLARYFWHAVYMGRGAGRSGEFRGAGGSPASLAGIVARANLDALRRAPELWRQRREIRRGARMSPKQFARLLKSYSISPREVAAQ